MKDYGINLGLVQKFDTSDRRTKGAYWGFRKMFWTYLTKTHVPFVDDCCDAAGTSVPMRYNTTTKVAEYYDAASDTWKSISGGADNTPQTLTGAGAVDLTSAVTLLVTTGANALTLADGTEGQYKMIKMKTDGGDGTLTPAHLLGGTTITFNDAGDFVYLLFTDGSWTIITNSGATVA